MIIQSEILSPQLEPNPSPLENVDQSVVVEAGQSDKHEAVEAGSSLIEKPTCNLCHHEEVVIGWSQEVDPETKLVNLSCNHLVFIQTNKI